MTRYLVGKIQKSQVLALLRSLYREKRSGQLELEHNHGVESIFLVSGSIYLRPASPLVEELIESAAAQDQRDPLRLESIEPPLGHESNLHHDRGLEFALSKLLSRLTPQSVRFIDSLSVNAKDLVGPFQTDLLIDHMENRSPPTPQPVEQADMSSPKPDDHQHGVKPAAQTAAAKSASIAEPQDEGTKAERLDDGKPTIIPGPWGNPPAAEQPAGQGGPSRARSQNHPETAIEASSSTQKTDLPTSGGSDASRIWRDHFGLTESPFSLTPDPSYFFLGGGHVEALAGLKLGLIEKRGLMVLVGEVGTGKTTIIYSLLSSIGPEMDTAYVSNPSLSFDEILESAIKDLGAEPSGSRRLDRLEALNDFLLQAEESGKSVAIVIDEAQGLSRRGYEQLRLLLNFETFKNKLLQIVLVGQPELTQRLARPELRQIADRIAVRCHLNPLKNKDAERYLAHRLEAAGGSLDLLTVPARRLVLRAARGNPRRINVICHNAMVFSFAKGASRVDRSVVSEAIRDMKG